MGWWADLVHPISHSVADAFDTLYKESLRPGKQFLGIEAAEKAKELAEQNAKLAAAQAAREEQLMKEKAARTQGLARATAAASGVGGATQNDYIAALTAQAQKEIDWFKKVSAQQIQLIKDEGDVSASAAIGQGIRNFVSLVALGA